MERHDNGRQPDECDVRWNLPNSNEQTGVESMDHPVLWSLEGLSF